MGWERKTTTEQMGRGGGDGGAAGGGERGEETNSNVNGRGFVLLGQCALPLDTRVRMYAARDVWKYREI